MLRLIVLSFILIISSICNAEPDCSKPPPRENFSQCCSKPGKVLEIKKKCMQDFPLTGKSLNFCYGECVFKESGLIKNGEIQVDDAKTIAMNTMGSNEEEANMFVEVLKKCVEVGKAKLAKVMEEKPEGMDKCPPLPSLVSLCLYGEMFVNCPTSMWKNTDTCNETKEFIKACSMKKMS